jgi:hypothetical protein
VLGKIDMKTTALILPVVLALSAQPANAAVYDITKWTCQRVLQTIANEGMAVLRYRSARNPSLPLYDRYVFGSRFCKPGQSLRFASVPTVDDKHCPVKRCEAVARIRD